MIRFRVPDMDCEGCVKKVTKAIHAVDPDAAVETDLKTKEVAIETSANEADIIDSLDEFGYDVEKM